MDHEDPHQELLYAAALLTLNPLHPHQLLTSYPCYRRTLLTLIPHLQLYVVQLLDHQLLAGHLLPLDGQILPLDGHVLPLDGHVLPLDDPQSDLGASAASNSHLKESGSAVQTPSDSSSDQDGKAASNHTQRTSDSATSHIVALRTVLECLQFCDVLRNRIEVASIMKATLIVLESMHSSKERLEFLSAVQQGLVICGVSSLRLGGGRTSLLSYIVDVLAEFATHDASRIVGAVNDIFLLGFAVTSSDEAQRQQSSQQKSALPDLTQFLDSISLIPDFLAKLGTLTTQEAKEHFDANVENLQVSNLRISYLYLTFCAIYMTRRLVEEDVEERRRIFGLLAYDTFHRLSSTPGMQVSDLTMLNNYSIQVFNILNLRARQLAQYGFQTVIDEIKANIDKSLKVSSEYKTFLAIWEDSGGDIEPERNHIWTNVSASFEHDHQQDTLYNIDATEREMELVKIIEASLPPKYAKTGKGYLIIALRVGLLAFPSMPIDQLVEDIIANPATFECKFPKDLHNLPLNLTFQRLKEFLVARQSRKFARPKKKADLSDIPKVPRDVQNKTLSLVRAQEEADIAAEEALEFESFGIEPPPEAEGEEGPVLAASIGDQPREGGAARGRGRGRGRRGRGGGRGPQMEGSGFRGKRRTRPRNKHVDPFKE